MSKPVIDSGRLIPVDLTAEAALAECQRLGLELEWILEAYGDAKEALCCETDEYAEIEGLGFCRVEGFKTTDPDESWCTLTKNEDGSYSFRASYYNGGAHWTELVEWAVKNG
jgi:hypothetical protein